MTALGQVLPSQAGKSKVCTLYALRTGQLGIPATGTTQLIRHGATRALSRNLGVTSVRKSARKPFCCGLGSVRFRLWVKRRPLCSALLALILLRERASRQISRP